MHENSASVLKGHLIVYLTINFNYTVPISYKTFSSVPLPMHKPKNLKQS